jgi:peptidoglycan/LPS O-acetylase OafA/YrhL
MLTAMRASDVLLRLLLVVWALTLAGRILIFGEGGTAGAYASTALFWAIALGLILSLLWGLMRKRGETLERVLALTLLIAFVLRVFVSTGPTASVINLLLFVSVLGLVAVYARKVWKSRGDTRHPAAPTR